MGLRSLLIRYTHRNLKLSDFRATRNASPLASTRNRRLHSHGRRQLHWKKGRSTLACKREAAPKRHSQPASRAQEQEKRTRTPVARPLYNGSASETAKTARNLLPALRDKDRGNLAGSPQFCSGVCPHCAKAPPAGRIVEPSLCLALEAYHGTGEGGGARAQRAGESQTLPDRSLGTKPIPARFRR